MARDSRVSPFTTGGEILPFDGVLREIGEFAEAETRLGTAERAVVPLGMAEGALDVLEEMEEDRRDAGGAAREEVVVAMWKVYCPRRIFYFDK